MKRFILCSLMALLFCGVGMAQQKQDNKEKKSAELTTVVLLSDIDCDHCKAKIVNNVPTLGKGIKELDVNVETKEITVTFDSSKNSTEGIIKGLATLRVKAQPIVKPETDK